MAGRVQNARSIVDRMASALDPIPVSGIAAIAAEMASVIAMPIVAAVGITECAIPAPIAVIEGAIGTVIIAVIVVAAYRYADPFVIAKTVIPGHAATQYQCCANEDRRQPGDFRHVDIP